MKSNEINVEVICVWHDFELTEKVNAWLDSHDVEVTDIKFQLSRDEYHEYHSAMIIYKK